ncbi:hypothetical protein WH43_01190 [Rheinheimera sp. KL1]|uniref:nucleotidyl transferase AbiEii/AbiGii toxin family protein n=1 Tax=Rheinheimera sp. KL1 TaxID=1635005 RepID=UPI0006A96F6F|nr:nucleotidyl transferase AbiEii/AbiGii toxin family protein [Rheinheimera sp. KL1]KOO59968.1 hypothetical protein WH43_01190 [Rheinheimera sp. KL1]
MNLHNDKKAFEEAVRATARSLSLPVTYVEKDYWVTYALKSLANSDISESIVFKGGTSLSKAYRLISRFSEDVDIAVFTDGLGNGQIRKRVGRACDLMPGELIEVASADTTKNSHFRKVRFQYPKLNEDGVPEGQITNSILLEVNAFADPEPHKKMAISSFIADFLASIGQHESIASYALEPFDMNVLCTSRTLCEKIMGMIKASYGDNQVNNINNKIRHLYDIYYLLTDQFTKDFLQSPEFIQMVRKVIDTDRRTFNKSPLYWFDQPLSIAVVFANLESIWGDLVTTYNGDFKMMVIDKDLPTAEALFDMSQQIYVQLLRFDSDGHS